MSHSHRVALRKTLAEAASAAERCAGVSGSGKVRIVFEPSGKVRSATLQSANPAAWS